MSISSKFKPNAYILADNKYKYKELMLGVYPPIIPKML